MSLLLIIMRPLLNELTKDRNESCSSSGVYGGLEFSEESQEEQKGHKEKVKKV